VPAPSWSLNDWREYITLIVSHNVLQSALTSVSSCTGCTINAKTAKIAVSRFYYVLFAELVRTLIRVMVASPSGSFKENRWKWTRYLKGSISSIIIKQLSPAPTRSRHAWERPARSCQRFVKPAIRFNRWNFSHMQGRKSTLKRTPTFDNAGTLQN
jgi:hypothetical protein